MFSEKELDDYFRNNFKLINLYRISSDDYISFRCLYLNQMLNQAYVMAEQAIEKQLKLLLLLLNPEENIKRFNDHKIERLIKRVQSYSDLKLFDFIATGERLSETYEMFRYPDNRIGKINYSWGGNEIDEIDCFFFHLIDVSLLPEEIMFRTGLMVSIFEDRVLPKPIYYAINKNLAFNKRKNDLQIRFHSVRRHFYPGLYE